MIDVGAASVVATLSAKAWPDPDIHADAEYIASVLERELVALSNWGLYRQDVLSRNLSWSNPCHNDAAFWKANSKHFEEQDGAVIKALVALVAEQIEGPSSIGDLYSPVVLAVACHDMGQIVEAHPRGWKMLGRDAKKYLTTAMVSSDEGVKTAALLATQRLMVASLGG
jgi:V-type H+-transporting ATPase subunit H